MTDPDQFRMPFTGGTLAEFRQRIGKHALTAHGRFSELADRLPATLTPAEMREMLLAHHAAFYGYSVLSLLGFIRERSGEYVANEAAAMVDDIGANGDPPFCDDITSEPVTGGAE